MKAQLATSTSVVHTYLDSDNWGMQQKVDGIRMMVFGGCDTTTLNRNGEPLHNVPDSITSFFSNLDGWGFDGELLGDEYYIFDLLSIPQGPTKSWPLSKRYELLEKLKGKLRSPVEVLPLWTNGKAERLEGLRDSKAEGVIFKRLDAEYRGGRTPNYLKHKFVNQVDCVVIDEGFNDKSNLVLGLWNGSDYTEVGKCSSLTGDGPTVSVGDVVTVTILYVTASGKLYQPVTPKLREDKLPEECMLDQLDTLGTRKEVAT